MPSFSLFGFRFFFFNNEYSGNELEPIHIHVCKGDPVHGAPKWWVGYNKIKNCRLDNIKNYGFKKSDIPKIEQAIYDNRSMIIELWKNHFEGMEGEIHESVK